MLKFSANLGFLWKEKTLPQAIYAAKAAGFDAVECHWPYQTPAIEIKKALEDTRLEMISINTSAGEIAHNELGLSALPERKTEAKTAIDHAIEYARTIKAQNIHVMAGNASGEDARRTYFENLEYACIKAKTVGITILIEPLNAKDTPDYFLTNTQFARQVISEVGQTNLKLMFDCYHIQMTEKNIFQTFESLKPIIGHIQFSATPNRGIPFSKYDNGEIDFKSFFSILEKAGYQGPIGAEYDPKGPTENSLGWLTEMRNTFP